MAKELIDVKVSDPNRVLWNGKADSVSSYNSQGPFDILPRHANFITIIENRPIVITVGSEKKEFLFENAIIYTGDGKVSILTSTDLKV